MLTRRMLSKRFGGHGGGRGRDAWMAGAGSGGHSDLPPGAKKKILIAIFQRGAADGLNIVVPFGDKRYYEMRPSIAVPPLIRHPAGQNNRPRKQRRIGPYSAARPSISMATSVSTPGSKCA